ncbi:MAG: hypothetical protein LBE36_08935 [Flavobacteriaceae bacterium]|nr:hypothetical protein [Flavobacteriaceae bacterium]
MQQKNSEWLNEITHEKDTATIISKIKSKIKSDTIYKSAKPKNINIKDGGFDYETIDRKGNLCGGKILFLLYDYGKNKILILDLNDNPALITIINNINENNVSVAVVSRPLDGIALYGSRGSSGAVILHTNDKNLKKIIRQMKKKNIEYLHRKGKRK